MAKENAVSGGVIMRALGFVFRFLRVVACIVLLCIFAFSVVVLLFGVRATDAIGNILDGISFSFFGGAINFLRGIVTWLSELLNGFGGFLR